MQDVHTQAGVRVVYMMIEVHQVYMQGGVAQQKDYMRVGWMHWVIQAG